MLSTRQCITPNCPNLAEYKGHDYRGRKRYRTRCRRCRHRAQAKLYEREYHRAVFLFTGFDPRSPLAVGGE